jgi:hypothetical protein
MTETTKDLIARLMQHVEDTMCKADVDYPAGYEAGSRVSYDSDSLQTYFETELAAALAREAALLAAITEASDPDFIFSAMDNVHDMDVTMTDFAYAASKAIRAALEVKP